MTNAILFQPGQLIRFFSNGWHYTRVLETNGRIVVVKHYRNLKRKKTLEVSIDMVEAVNDGR